jgi:hypothetical protein
VAIGKVLMQRMATQHGSTMEDELGAMKYVDVYTLQEAMIYDGARWCKVLQEANLYNGGQWCKILQQAKICNGAQWCKMLQQAGVSNAVRRCTLLQEVIISYDVQVNSNDERKY